MCEGWRLTLRKTKSEPCSSEIQSLGRQFGKRTGRIMEVPVGKREGAWLRLGEPIDGQVDPDRKYNPIERIAPGVLTATVKNLAKGLKP